MLGKIGCRDYVASEPKKKVSGEFIKEPRLQELINSFIVSHSLLCIIFLWIIDSQVLTSHILLPAQKVVLFSRFCLTEDALIAEADVDRI